MCATSSQRQAIELLNFALNYAFRLLRFLCEPWGQGQRRERRLKPVLQRAPPEPAVPAVLCRLRIPLVGFSGCFDFSGHNLNAACRYSPIVDMWHCSFLAVLMFRLPLDVSTGNGRQLQSKTFRCDYRHRDDVLRICWCGRNSVVYKH